MVGVLFLSSCYILLGCTNFFRCFRKVPLTLITEAKLQRFKGDILKNTKQKCFEDGNNNKKKLRLRPKQTRLVYVGEDIRKNWELVICNF